MCQGHGQREGVCRRDWQRVGKRAHPLNPRRVKKLSIVRQTTGLMKVYVNPEAFCRETGRGMEEWAIEGHSVRLVPTSEAEL